jgi:hypothetical protein
MLLSSKLIRKQEILTAMLANSTKKNNPLEPRCSSLVLVMAKCRLEDGRPLPETKALEHRAKRSTQVNGIFINLRHEN